MNKKFEFNSIDLKYMNKYKNCNIYETTIYSVSSLKNPRDNTLIFANTLNEENQNRLKKIKNCIIILNESNSWFKLKCNCVLYVQRPRKEYAKILEFILKSQPIRYREYKFKDGYCIGENVLLGINTKIEPFVFIDHDVIIGENCIIKTGAKIKSNVVIGDNCIIKENCVIGDDGFGVERDNDGITYKIPHFGGVNIGNNVEVGALSCICKGTIEATIIEDYVKIDDCVFIAHNCSIGKGTFIIANAEISGSVHIGKMCWIAPNSCIREGIIIGDNTTIGIGAVVVENIDNDVVVVGNPARELVKHEISKS